jgi:hypothetical protein
MEKIAKPLNIRSKGHLLTACTANGSHGPFHFSTHWWQCLPVSRDEISSKSFLIPDMFSEIGSVSRNFFRNFRKWKQIQNSFLGKGNEFTRLLYMLETGIHCNISRNEFGNFPETNSSFFLDRFGNKKNCHVQLISFSFLYSKCLDLYHMY